LTIQNSIVAGNTAALGTGPDLVPDPDSTLTVNYSLIGNTSGSGVFGNTGTGNLLNVNPLLGPLADNGGPTQTHALLVGSPAINAGDPAFTGPPDFDQRGVPFERVRGPAIDIGSVEFTPLAVVNNTEDVDDGDPFNGMTSLREAINLANSNPGLDAIEFDAALSEQTIVLGGTQLVITEAVIIDASMLSNHVTINAAGQSRILFIDDPGLSDESFDVTLTGITLTGGRTTANGQHGGAIWSAQFGTLTLYESIVTGNHTEGIGARGGGIRSSGDVVLNQSTVSNNSTQGDDASGGGIHSSRAVILQESTVTGNSTAGSNAYGGGFVADFTSTITESIISENRTTGPNSNGGGFVFDGGTVTLIESTVSGNRTAGAGSLGGGVYATGPLKLVDSTVDGNFTMAANTHGGAIYNTDVLSINGSTVSGNHTNGQNSQGGAIFAKHGGVTINDSLVTGNLTSGDFADGGAIYSNGFNGSDVRISRSTISGNRTEGLSSFGGAIQAVQSDVTLSQSTLSGNTTAQAGSRGGAMWVSGELRLDQSTISGNSTAGSNADGGAIFTFSNIPVTIILSTITNNMATGQSGDGGAIFVSNLAQDLPLSVTGSILAGNTAAGSGNDLLPDPDSPLIANHSLIGTGMTPTSGGNNVSIDNPLLGPLADNGGPTLTHALLPGSPALDAGDPNAVAGMGGVPLYDQRGGPFVRVFDGDGAGGARIDIGAYELISDDALHALFGDYNRDGTTNAADYTVWRDSLGDTGVTAYSGADGDGDGDITANDYSVWKQHYGDTLPTGAGVGGLAVAIDSATGAAATTVEPVTTNVADEVATPVQSLDLPSLVLSTRLTTATRDASATPARSAISVQAVDLLLATTTRGWSANASDEDASLPASQDDDRASDDFSLVATGAALVGLNADF
jgi:CSLREA domain-containing protein